MRRSRSQKESDPALPGAGPSAVPVAESQPLAGLQQAAGNEAVNRLVEESSADPLAAELARSAPRSIQRTRTVLGDVLIAGEQDGPTYTAVTRGLSGLSDKRKAKLTGAIQKARGAVPKAIAAINAVDPTNLGHLKTLDNYFRISRDPDYVSQNAELGAAVAAAKQGAGGPDAKALQDKVTRLNEDLTVHQQELGKVTKSKAGKVLGAVRDGLAKDQVIKSLNPARALLGGSGTTRGYVHQGADGSAGDIHVNFSLLDKDSVGRLARTIVHEASHKFAQTDDVAYKFQAGEFNAMTNLQAINNADSYAEYVKDNDG